MSSASGVDQAEIAAGRFHESGSRRVGVIINADDWGCSKEITDRTLDCALRGVVSSASAMVFMEDSERAATLAMQHNVDTGLHLNLTASFTSPHCPARLREVQQKLVRFLHGSRMRSAIYHPGLRSAFSYSVKAQLDEYERLYRKSATRVDGHHHMHLSTNVLFQRLLPAGVIVRRNFSFSKGEKSALNRWYRRWQDRQLAKRHKMADYFFPLIPMNEPGRLEKVFALAGSCSVEVETHPINRDEYEFLMSAELMRLAHEVGIARSYFLA
jgi:chitin disaccharide deacetylase